MRWIAAATLLMAGSALAAPPPAGSEDDMLLSPYARDIASARTPGGGLLCCSVADGSAVDARATPDGWQIRFRGNRFPDAPKGWVTVPESAMLRNWHNPTGVPIAWWYGGVIRCFSPPSGT